MVIRGQIDVGSEQLDVRLEDNWKFGYNQMSGDDETSRVDLTSGANLTSGDDLIFC